MIKKFTLLALLALAVVVFFSFKESNSTDTYTAHYSKKIDQFKTTELALLNYIQHSDLNNANDVEKIKTLIQQARNGLKGLDFWLRYLEPLAYKKMNSPLPVEWETEVFEKFEKPYKREGAGLTLAALYLEEENITKDSLAALIRASLTAIETYTADSITDELKSYHHFYLCNRLYLLNLAAIYTTGFECPNTDEIIPELKTMLADVNNIYTAYDQSYSNKSLSPEYLALYKQLIVFVDNQPADYSKFDHFTFIKDYINPLYTLNQKLIKQYTVVSKNLLDYSLNKANTSIFNKSLYHGQNTNGIFMRVTDTAVLAEIDHIGKLLFYDPILSANNMRSCASCHKPTEYFTDTMTATAFEFNHKDFLPRNAPSLINVEYNHLAMMDGKHISLQNQTKDVICNPKEMGSDEKQVLEKVLSCKEYKSAFTKLLKYTPQEPEITMDHIVSAITVYYNKFSHYYSPFDEAMNNTVQLDAQAKDGFNLFMSKAQCATCHFVPQFNGVKPPYIGSEFEVLGVPQDTAFKALSADKGRHGINPAYETNHAFRTGSVRNAKYTKPYMHNGVFNSLEQVIDFYDAGGGAGRGLTVENQTLSSDSLKLSKKEKTNLINFINSLNESIVFEAPPEKLPKSKIKTLNNRKVGGIY